MSATDSAPAPRDLINLDFPTEVKIAPDGSKVAVSLRTTNWKDNCYETICTIHNVETGEALPLNRTGSALQVEWVDEHSLAMLKRSTGENDKPQIWHFDHLTGEGLQITDHENGVEQFKPYAGGFLFLASDPERTKKKERTEKFGKFTYFEKEESASALYYVGLAEWIEYQQRMRKANEDEVKILVKPVIELTKLLPKPLKIERFIHSPQDDAVYLNCRSRDDLVYFRETSSYQIKFNAQTALAELIQREKDKNAQEEDAPKQESDQAEDFSYLGELTQLNLPTLASVTDVSPDGEQLLISYQARDQKMFTQSDLWVLATQKAVTAPTAEIQQSMQLITDELDRDPLFARWQPAGIFLSYVDHQVMKVAQIDDTGQLTEIDFGDVYPYPMFASLDISPTGRLAMIAANATQFSEVYFAEPSEQGTGWKTKKLSTYGDQLANWNLGNIETIRWTSKDGTKIEGVLRKPTDFDPNKKYPLAFVVHGGPRWFSPQYLVTGADLSYYPSVQLSNKDVLILYPNYRGSLGRGQAFSELNKDNLGIGDLWDLESAIEHLDQLGYLDTDRVGCMGWSQGGYISAFAATHSDKFAAVSVGAGISDWYTYHISNDIPDFTVDYLSCSPFQAREVYDQTAPIKNLSQNSAPTLIQHGAEDQRVPISNAMELYRGLQAMGVPTELFIFPGMGHPITKPRENHAVLHQNLAWFSHYLLGEELALI